jgi:hypothetical protein
VGLVTRRATGRAHPGAPDRFEVAWTEALDELELDVDRAEALLCAEHARAAEVAETLVRSTAWVPPQLRTPLPETLRERAERLLERQLVVTGRLAAAMTSSRRHLDVVERLVPSDPRPMYVDQAL